MNSMGSVEGRYPILLCFIGWPAYKQPHVRCLLISPWRSKPEEAAVCLSMEKSPGKDHIGWGPNSSATPVWWRDFPLDEEMATGSPARRQATEL